ncbi:MAG: hypothetical protein HDR82_10690 [Bacteroides sp.]|nr:hypothetical protein [Bacteroides sp.]
MKLIYRNIIALMAFVAMAVGFTACDADPDFEHPNNLISDVRIKSNPTADGIAGVITEYNAAGEVVPADKVTLEAVKGGYGKVEFILSPALEGSLDPERCYLSASLTFDEIVTPGLAGIKNITNRDAQGVAQGIEITVTSGTGDTRRYQIIGYYEGQYQYIPEDNE